MPLNDKNGFLPSFTPITTLLRHPKLMQSDFPFICVTAPNTPAWSWGRWVHGQGQGTQERVSKELWADVRVQKSLGRTRRAAFSRLGSQNKVHGNDHREVTQPEADQFYFRRHKRQNLSENHFHPTPAGIRASSVWVLKTLCLLLHNRAPYGLFGDSLYVSRQ